jgi:hypothetical protein
MVVKIVKLIESNQRIYENKPYGPVDVRTSESETDEEKQAAIESLKSFNYATDDKNILRLVAIFIDERLKKAILDSELLFEETIDLLKRQPLAKIRNCDGAGYWVNMDTGETIYFQKPYEYQNNYFNQMYQISLGPYSPMFGEQIISSRRDIEAVESFVRSIHWYNDSNVQTKLYLQFLYKWIAIETITKTNNDEDIVPKLCLSLGFPLSKHHKSIPKCIAEKLKTINGYKHYRNIIRDEFYKCKKIRNAIVHSGFKETNLLDENLKLKLYVINATYNCMINNIEKIIASGKNSLEEVWDTMSKYVTQDNNLINWISGTFLKQMNQLISKGSDNEF